MNNSLTVSVFIFSSLLFSTFSLGQEAYSASPQTSILNFVTNSSTIEIAKTKGSPYLNEDFVKGQVSIDDKVIHKGKMRFNAYRNEVELLDKNVNSSYFSLLKRAYIKVEIGGKHYAIFTYKDTDGSIRTSYFSKLNEGNLKLLYKPEAILRQARRPSTSYEKYVPATYVWNSSYYVLDESGNSSENHAVKTRLSRRNILAFTGDMKDEMKQYIKEQQLNLREEKEVVSFFKYYNSIKNSEQ